MVDRRGELEDQRSQDLMQARTVESQLKALLKANKGQVLAEDVVYEPTGERIAQMGEVAADEHQSKLEHVVQEHRELIELVGPGRDRAGRCRDGARESSAPG